MKKLLIVVGILIAANANAFNGGPFQSDPNATPFQTLEKAYADANEMVTLDDFDLYGVESSQHCVMARNDNQPPFQTNLKKYIVEQVIPGTPPSGPLFPGEPEKRIQTPGFLLYSYATGSESALKDLIDELILQHHSMQYLGNELVVNYAEWASYGDSPAEYRIKKNGGTIHFSAKAYLGKPEESQFYGYCWRE